MSWITQPIIEKEMNMAVEVPEKLKNKKKYGTILHADTDLKETGYSIVGTKTICYTNKPGVYLHDTGGLFGDDIVDDLAIPRSHGSYSLCLRNKSTELYFNSIARITGKSVEHSITSKQVIKRILAAQYKKSAKNNQDTYHEDIELSIKCDWEESAEILAFRYDEVHPDEKGEELHLRFDKNDYGSEDELQKFFKDRDDHTLETQILLSHLIFEEFYSKIEIKGNNLILRKSSDSIASIPLLSTRVRNLKKGSREIKLVGSFLIQGHVVNGISIFFLDHESAKSFLALLPKIKTPPPKNAGVNASAMAWGLDEKNKLMGKVDVSVNLTNTDLTILNGKTHKTIYRFDFTKNTIVQGHDDKIILATKSQGPIALQISDELILHRVYANPKIRDMALLSFENGPFLFFNDIGNPVRATVKSSSVELSGDEIENIQLDNIKEFVISLSENPAMEISFKKGKKLKYSAQYDMLEGFHSAVRTQMILPLVKGNEKKLIDSILGFEGEHFTFMLCKDLIGLHLFVKDNFPESSATREAGYHTISSPKEEVRIIEILSFMLSNIQSIIKKLEHLKYRFAYELEGFDRKILNTQTLESERFFENSTYANSSNLSRVQSMVQMLSRIESVLLQQNEIRLATQTEISGTEIAGLVLSLGLSVVNPLALLGATKQAASMYQKSSKGDKKLSTSLSRASEIAFQYWNDLVNWHLEPNCRQIVDNIYASRIEYYQLLLKDIDSWSEQTYLSVSRRLARLEALQNGPAVEGSSIQQKDILDYLVSIESISKDHHIHRF